MSDAPSLRLRVLRRLKLAPPPSPPPPPPPPAMPDALDARHLLNDPWFRKHLQIADQRLPTTPAADRPALFDAVPLDVFALLALHRPAEFSNLAAWLPAMPTPEQQHGSTGATGQHTLLQAADFVRATVTAVGGSQALRGARMLDYGVCWARIARLFYKYVEVERIHGVDAWPDSLNLARVAGFGGPLAVVDSTPEALPFDGPFDLITAFSVFTHLTEDAARAAAGAIRKGLRPGGVFAFTIRPSAYPQLLGDAGPAHAADLARTGFGFTPEPFAIENGEPYGNATIGIDHLLRSWPGFALAGVEVSGFDPYQVYVFLRAV